MVTSPRAALNTRRESHLPIYLIGREVRQYFMLFIFMYNVHFNVRKLIILIYMIFS